MKKNVLLVCPVFFEYSTKLIHQLQIFGFSVIYIDERPSNDFISKFLIRKSFKPYNYFINKYYKNALRKINEKIDYILFIKCETPTEFVLKMFEEKFPDVQKILYLWDSIKNIREIERKFKYFHDIFSFDFEDIEKYKFIKYAYWGYIDQSNTARVTKNQWDISFVGTAHSIRPRVVKDFKRICKEQNLSCYFYLYSPNILVYLYNKLINKDFKYITLKDVSFKSLSFSQTYDIYNDSRMILDICAPNQSGFTSRVGDMINLRKKLITNNTYILKTDLYTFENVYYYDVNNVELSTDFIKINYKNFEKRVIEQYSFKTFLETIFKL